MTKEPIERSWKNAATYMVGHTVLMLLVGAIVFWAIPPRFNQADLPWFLLTGFVLGICGGYVFYRIRTGDWILGGRKA